MSEPVLYRIDRNAVVQPMSRGRMSERVGRDFCSRWQGPGVNGFSERPDHPFVTAGTSKGGPGTFHAKEGIVPFRPNVLTVGAKCIP